MPLIYPYSYFFYISDSIHLFIDSFGLTLIDFAAYRAGLSTSYPHSDGILGRRDAQTV